ncbi:MAG: nuclear transport factor 2 family protein [Flavobacterium sp.]|nr:MAG: nuclear transport factor 2 family protein [Flavobacterium sp.]
MNAKELVSEFYSDENFMVAGTMDRFLHNDLELQWYSTKGFLRLDKEALIALGAELDKSYTASRINVSHVIAENDMVTVRYTHNVNAFENPNEEMVLAHFVVIWEVKDDKLYRGYLMSQLD